MEQLALEARGISFQGSLAEKQFLHRKKKNDPSFKSLFCCIFIQFEILSGENMASRSLVKNRPKNQPQIRPVQRGLLCPVVPGGSTVSLEMLTDFYVLMLRAKLTKPSCHLP